MPPQKKSNLQSKRSAKKSTPKKAAPAKKSTQKKATPAKKASAPKKTPASKKKALARLEGSVSVFDEQVAKCASRPRKRKASNLLESEEFIRGALPVQVARSHRGII